MEVSREVILPVGLDAAWTALTRWEDQATWMKDADLVRVESVQREGVGTLIAVKTRIYNVPLFTERMEVLAWEPPHRLLMAHRTFVRGTGEWRFEPAGSELAGSGSGSESTRFVWTEDVTIPPPVLGDLAALVYRPFLRRLMGRSLHDLAVHLSR